MDWNNVAPSELSVEFTPNAGLSIKTTENQWGGFFKDKKEYAWLTDCWSLQILSTQNGYNICNLPLFVTIESDPLLVASHQFKCNDHGIILALVFKKVDSSANSSVVVLYSLKKNLILKFIQFHYDVLSLTFLPRSVCSLAIISEFDGTLILGTQDGRLIFVDLQLKKLMRCTEDNATFSSDSSSTVCTVHGINESPDELSELFQHYRQNTEYNFALKSKGVRGGAVTSLCLIEDWKTLAIGSSFGTLNLYDLEMMKVFYSTAVSDEAVMRIEYVLPIDDPCPCFYLWSIYGSNNGLSVALFSVMFDERNFSSSSIFSKAFRKCTLRFDVALEDSPVENVDTQAVCSTCTLKEEFVTSLCFFSWYSKKDAINKIVLFDLNQWYKEEMPNQIGFDYKHQFLTAFKLNESGMSLQTLIEPSSLAHYNSIYRTEEHFYPNSLSFDCMLMFANCCKSFTWLGLQMKVIDHIKFSNCSILMQAESCVRDIIDAGLMPQFIDYNTDAEFNEKEAYNVILSFALENRCYHLLRDCISSCVNGPMNVNVQLVFMDWIWVRVCALEKRCKLLCVGLFDSRRSYVDLDIFQELDSLSKQLTFLSTLITELFEESKYQGDDLQKLKKLRIHTGFYNILVWMLNNNLLVKQELLEERQIFRLINYNSVELEELYVNRRRDLSLCRKLYGEEDENAADQLESLFIDLLLEREFKKKTSYTKSKKSKYLKKMPVEVYPPKSLQEALNMFMVEDVDLDHKYIFILYFFLDWLHMVEYNSLDILSKFGSAFNVRDSLVMRAFAFWKLDKGFLLDAVNVLIGPKSEPISHPKWCIEVFVEALLRQNEPKQAIRVLKTVPSLISVKLKTEILLWNELFFEALQLVRKNNTAHKEQERFFRFLLEHKRFDVIQKLDLNRKELYLLQILDKSCSSNSIENPHLLYALQKFNYIDAFNSVEHYSKQNSLGQQFRYYPDLGSNVLLKALKSTIAPIAQHVTDIYCAQKSKIKGKPNLESVSQTMSCQLLKENLSKDQFFLQCWQSSLFASDSPTASDESQNVAFLRKPQEYTEKRADANEKVSIPKPYKVAVKRPPSEIRGMSPEAPNPKRHKRSSSRDNTFLMETFLKVCNTSTTHNSGQLPSTEHAKEFRAVNQNIQGILKGKESAISDSASDTEKNLRFTSLCYSDTETMTLAEEMNKDLDVETEKDPPATNELRDEKEEAVNKEPEQEGSGSVSPNSSLVDSLEKSCAECPAKQPSTANFSFSVNKTTEEVLPMEQEETEEPTEGFVTFIEESESGAESEADLDGIDEVLAADSQKDSKSPISIPTTTPTPTETESSSLEIVSHMHHDTVVVDDDSQISSIIMEHTETVHTVTEISRTVIQQAPSRQNHQDQQDHHHQASLASAQTVEFHTIILDDDEDEEVVDEVKAEEHEDNNKMEKPQETAQVEEIKEDFVLVVADDEIDKELLEEAKDEVMELSMSSKLHDDLNDSRVLRRSKRSASLPPNRKESTSSVDKQVEQNEVKTPRKQRGKSLPPNKDKPETLAKQALTERLLTDSPATRTRSRTRLSSISESELDSPIVEVSRKRHVSSEVKDSPRNASKRGRPSLQSIAERASSNSKNRESSADEQDNVVNVARRRSTRHQAATAVASAAQVDDLISKPEEEDSNDVIAEIQTTKTPRRRRNSKAESDDDARSVSSRGGGDNEDRPLRRNLRRSTQTSLQAIPEGEAATAAGSKKK